MTNNGNNNRRQYASSCSSSAVPTSSYGNNKHTSTAGGVQLSSAVFENDHNERLHTFDVNRYENATDRNDDKVPFWLFWGSIAVIAGCVITSVACGLVVWMDVVQNISVLNGYIAPVVGTIITLPSGVTKVSVDATLVATNIVLTEQIIITVVTCFELLGIVGYIIFGGFVAFHMCAFKARGYGELAALSAFAALALIAIGSSAQMLSVSNITWWNDNFYQTTDVPPLAIYTTNKASFKSMTEKVQNLAIVQLSAHVIAALPVLGNLGYTAYSIMVGGK